MIEVKDIAMKFRCSHCGQRLEVDASMLGTAVECPNCVKPFTLPVAPKLDLSTTDSIPGYEIERHCGVVSSVVVLGSNAVADLKASFSDIFGGKSDAYTRVFGGQGSGTENQWRVCNCAPDVMAFLPAV